MPVFSLCGMYTMCTRSLQRPDEGIRTPRSGSLRGTWATVRVLRMDKVHNNRAISPASPHAPFFPSQHENFLLTLHCSFSCCFFPAEDPSSGLTFPRVCRHCSKFCFVAFTSCDPFLPLCGTWRPYFGNGLFPLILSYLSVGPLRWQ